MRQCHLPIPAGVPVLLCVANGQKEQLEDSLVGREEALGFEDSTQLKVQRFDGVGGVEHLADGGRIGQKGNDLGPPLSPQTGNRRIFLAPCGFKLGHGIIGSLFIRSGVDRFKGGNNSPLVGVLDIAQSSPYQVDNAGLNHGVRKSRLDGIGKARQPVAADEENVLHAPVF